MVQSNNDDVATHKEFIFWHVVGCSRISCMMAHMLRRLETELREHFDLTREVGLPLFEKWCDRRV